MYAEEMIAPMRKELTNLGVEEARTPEQVDELVGKPGTTMVVVNSVCGCAAAMARPAVSLALQSEKKPSRSITVFAGSDIEATDKVRSHFVGYPPSSPSIALMKEGELVFMLERHQIEGRSAEEIANDLQGAFEKHC